MTRSEWYDYYSYYLKVMGRSSLESQLKAKEEAAPLWKGHRDEGSHSASISAMKEVLSEEVVTASQNC